MVGTGEKIAGELRKGQMSRSEFGESGNEVYFEEYIADITIVPCNRTNDRTYFELGGSSFLLGHPTSSQLGSVQLGQQLTAGSENLRISEENFFIDYVDDLTTTNSRDAGNTDADWDGTGSISFAGGSQAQTINVGSDIKLNTTDFDRVRVAVGGSNLGDLEIYARTDSRASFQQIDNNINTILTGTVGSDPKVRLIDNTNKAIVSNIDTTFRQKGF